MNIVSFRALFIRQTDERTKISIYWALDGAKKLMITHLFFSFRADYLKMYRQRTRSDLEGFTNFMAQGVRTEYLESVFPAESFPAWQTIQTGENCQIPGARCISQIIDSLSEVLSFDPLLREIEPK